MTQVTRATVTITRQCGDCASDEPHVADCPCGFAGRIVDTYERAVEVELERTFYPGSFSGPPEDCCEDEEDIEVLRSEFADDETPVEITGDELETAIDHANAGNEWTDDE